MVGTGGVGDEERRRNPVLCGLSPVELGDGEGAYPLPRINDTLDMLAGKRWFSTLDLVSGYWSVVIGRSPCLRKSGARLPLPLTRDSFNSKSCRLDSAMH